MHAIAAKALDLSCEVSGLSTKSCEAGGSWKSWSWTNSLNFSKLQFPSTSWHLCTTYPSIQARGEPSRRCWRVGKSKAALENLPGSPTVWRTISLYPCSWSTIFKEGNNAEWCRMWCLDLNFLRTSLAVSTCFLVACSTIAVPWPWFQNSRMSSKTFTSRCQGGRDCTMWALNSDSGPVSDLQVQETLKDLSVPTWFKDT